MTRPRDWRRASLEWEAAWLREPEGVAADVGLSVATLDERPTDERTVLDALSRKLQSTSQDDEVVGGLTGTEIVETIVLVLRRDDVDEARALARSAREASPRNERLLGVWASCAIPVKPADARSMFEEIMPRGGTERPILLANVVSTYLAEGDSPLVRSLLDELLRCCGDAEGWLWEPASLWRRDTGPALQSVHVEDWIGAAREVTG